MFYLQKNRKLFYECDSCQEAIKIYDKSGQEHVTNHFDTMTSWVEIAKSFLGYGYRVSFNKMYDDYSNSGNEEEWVKNRIKSNYPGTIDDIKIDDAFDAFLKFSGKIYSLGNLIPVGYNPGRIRRNDRWDVKLNWIYEIVFLKKKMDNCDNRKNAWNTFIGKMSWEEYIDKYFLNDYVKEKDKRPLDPIEFPQKPCVDTWIKFLSYYTDKIEKREKRVLKKINLQNIAD